MGGGVRGWRDEGVRRRGVGLSGWRGERMEG